MRALAAFLAAIFGSLLVAALLAWPAWLATHALVPEWQFHRVVSRLWQLLLLAGLLVALRRLGIRGRDDWGYGLPRPVFLRQAGVGLAIGLVTAFAATRLLGSILYDTQPGDPATFAGIAALLGASAIVATLVPAWRATRIEPVDAIKSE